MTRIRKRKCKHCKEYFLPDHRNKKKQWFCSKPQCRKASKAASQQKWLKKPQNKDYFRGPEHVERVRQWRKNNPDYRQKSKNVLQDHCRENENKKQRVKSSLHSLVLQDLLLRQPAVLIGLIANLTGSALQDDIAVSISRMQQLGNDILNPFSKGDRYDPKNAHL